VEGQNEHQSRPTLPNPDRRELKPMSWTMLTRPASAARVRRPPNEQAAR
jgi:hypothetical protein